MEGSWTFAGCVIPDSKSSTPSHALFYTKHDWIGRFRLRGLRDFRHKPDLSPDQAHANQRAAPPCSGHRNVMGRLSHARATNRLAAFVKAMSWQLTIASNGLWSGLDSHHAFARRHAPRALARSAFLKMTAVSPTRRSVAWN